MHWSVSHLAMLQSRKKIMVIWKSKEEPIDHYTPQFFLIDIWCAIRKCNSSFAIMLTSFGPFGSNISPMRNAFLDWYWISRISLFLLFLRNVKKIVMMFWKNLFLLWHTLAYTVDIHRQSEGIQKAKTLQFYIKDLPFAFRGICLLRERHLYLLKIYRILPSGGKNVPALEGIFL